MKIKSIYPYLLIAPAMILVIAVNFYPTLYSFYLSTTRYRFDMSQGQFVTEFVGLHHYRLILDSVDFWESLRLTLVFSVLFIPITMILAFGLALLFNRSMLLGGLYMTMIFVPWVLSEIVAGVVWRWMFYRNYGVLQNLIGPLIGDVTLMADKKGAMGVVTLASVWKSVAFAMLLILAGLQTIPKELYEAAAIDGANRRKIFIKITWPLVQPTTLVTVVFLSLQSVNSIGLFLAITDGGPGRATEVLSLHMYREALQYFHFEYGAALSVMMLILNAVLAAIYFQFLKSESALASY
ncbi:MAG: carbohydrate ABC transporter permease [Aggregatilineaceae bacterium]